MNNQQINAAGVIKPETAKKLESQLSQRGVSIVNGWVASNPKQVKAWEREGKLLALAKEADQDAAEAIQQADRDKAAWPGMPALASHEIYEIYGSPLLQRI
jgi:hypothetical protein